LARLGNSNNQTRFFDYVEPVDCEEIRTWKKSEADCQEMRVTLRRECDVLLTLLEKKNEYARLKEGLRCVETERRYVEDYVGGNSRLSFQDVSVWRSLPTNIPNCLVDVDLLGPTMRFLSVYRWALFFIRYRVFKWRVFLRYFDDIRDSLIQSYYSQRRQQLTQKIETLDRL
jgi:hypothetical protein